MSDVAGLSDLKFVEIGGAPFLKSAFPQQTRFFSTYHSAHPDPAAGTDVVTWRTLRAIRHAITDPATALVLCHPTPFAPWHWQSLIRAVFRRNILEGRTALARAFGPQLTRWPGPAPLAVLDMDDLPAINRNNLFLLKSCRVYFKRELPPDRWRLFMRTAHPNLPTPRFRRNARRARLLDKIEPISLGLPLGRPLPPLADEPKQVDVFFAGRVDDSSTVRRRGLPELLALLERGVSVDIPDAPLDAEEFHRRCARAWLVWSPEGLGWDCFRHYEALACHSVPLINQPRIERYRPLAAGAHALYYDVEPGALSAAVREGLADKERLRRIAAQGRAHVLAHHTPSALAHYVVRRALSGQTACDAITAPSGRRA